MSRSGRQLLTSTDDPLDLARIEAGTVELRMEPVVGQDLVDAVVAALRVPAESKGLRLHARVPREDVVIASDRRVLSRILLDLADNAIKFTETGDVVLVLEHVHGERDTFVEFRVVDSGIGIRAAEQARLFSPSARGRDAKSGLHVSQELAALIGGRITCNSEHGQGSTFTLILEEAPDRRSLA